MRRALVVLVPLLLLVAGIPAADARAIPRVFVLELDDTIQPASLRYVERGLEEAAGQDAALVVIELDTPGGLLESLRAMTSAILGSPVPVAIHVTPSGARAASAGFFLLLAADIAAMAPGTNTGAAHPVTIGGSPRRDDDPDDKSGADPAVDKAVEDAAALARSLAEGRGRSTELAERAVVESASFTAEEALAHGLIDVIATGRSQLLAKLDGRTITRFDGRRQALELDGASIVVVEHTLAERILTVIASPQIAYLLLMLGVMGILFELMNPGLLVPGIGGGIALLLGMYGLSVLPVNVSGAVLIVLGLALLIAEVFVTSYGLLAVGGLASFVAGSLMLVDAPVPELRIGPEVVVPVALVLVAIVAFLVPRVMRAQRLGAQTGTESMIGESGRVIAPIDPAHDGKVFVHGEYWAATSTQTLPTGASIRVEAIDGLRLRVAPEAVLTEQGGRP